MHKVTHVLMVAGLAMSAASAQAGNLLVKSAPAAVAVPDVPDGDLGCVVRMMILSFDNTKFLKDPNLGEAERKSAEHDLAVADRHLAFYLGRVSANPPKLPLDPTFDARISTVLAEPSDVSARENVICDEFARATKPATLRSLKAQ